MAYIGNTPAENYASFLTETFSVSATASYTLSHAVSNENDIRLVINGVVQQPGSGKAYTASGTTLTLTSATASGDVMYAVYLGRALQTVNPPNASVGSAQIADSLISGKTALGATPADTDELLISDAGTLKRVDYSHLKSSMTPAFAATLSGDISVDNAETLTKVVFDTEEFDTDNTFSSGRFTPGVVGKYFISGNVNVTNGSNGVVNIAVMRIYKNGSQLTGSDLRVDFRGNPGKGASLSLTAVVSLDADDYIEFYAANLATGGSANIESYGSRIGGYRILE